MSEERPVTVLCLASFFKGNAFLQECKREGCRVILVTVENLASEGWARDAIDEVFLMPSLSNRQDVTNAVSYLARTRVIDRIVPLDDYDVETAAALREHLRVPGMGDTTARFFRDKLAMRVQARDQGILVPDFVPVVNYDQLNEFMSSHPAPWVLKPRSEASSVGITKLENSDQLWPVLDRLGDRQSYYVLEQFIEGDVYHVDAITSEREMLFAEAHKYSAPPLSVVQQGGLFMSAALPRDGADAVALRDMQRRVIRALNFVRGVTHTEYIKAKADGRFYFLETAARVGGANIAEMVEAATGINLWAEWAKIEIGGGHKPYTLPELQSAYAGIIISLARQEWPDTSYYNDPEIVWRLNRFHHAGLIVKAANPERVLELLNSYAPRFYNDFFASQPPPEDHKTA